MKEIYATNTKERNLVETTGTSFFNTRQIIRNVEVKQAFFTVSVLPADFHPDEIMPFRRACLYGGELSLVGGLPPIPRHSGRESFS